MPSAVTAIVGLFFPCRPFAVIGRVRTIIVDTINSQFGRLNPHIVQESLKAVTPSLADHNSSAAIVGVGGCVWIVTSLNHLHPTCVSGRMGKSVFGKSVAYSGKRQFKIQTSTRLRCSSCQRIGADSFFFPAIAAAQPSGRLGVSRGKDGPSSKLLSVNEPNCFRHFGSQTNKSVGLMAKAMGVPLMG
jgi:hypothetical protein